MYRQLKFFLMEKKDLLSYTPVFSDMADDDMASVAILLNQFSKNILVDTYIKSKPEWLLFIYVF